MSDGEVFEASTDWMTAHTTVPELLERGFKPGTARLGAALMRIAVLRREDSVLLISSEEPGPEAAD